MRNRRLELASNRRTVAESISAHMYAFGTSVTTNEERTSRVCFGRESLEL